MNRRKGFTLVEILAVMVILSIILVLVIPNILHVSQSSTLSLLESKIKTLVSVGEKYGNERINEYQACLSSLSSNELKTQCTLSFDQLLQEGYIDGDDEDGRVIDPTTKKPLAGEILLCYEPSDVQIYGKYVHSDEDYFCEQKEGSKSNTLNLSSNNGSGYIGGDDIEVHIISTGTFQSAFSCTSNNARYATCEISGRTMRIKITHDRTLATSHPVDVELVVTGLHSGGKKESTTYNLKIFTTDLKIVGENNACIKTGVVYSDYLETKNTGALTVKVNNPNVLEAVAKNGELYLAARSQTGLANVEVSENNGKLTSIISKRVYKMDVDEIETEILVNREQEVKIDHGGAGTITITSSNPSVLKVRKGTGTASSSITLSALEKVFKVVAVGKGSATLTIKGTYCGLERTTVAVSNMALSENEGTFYVNGSSRDISIGIEDSSNLACRSSNTSVAECVIRSTIMTVTPHNAGKAVISIYKTDGSGGYAEYTAYVNSTTLQIVDGSNNPVTSVCQEIGNRTQTYTVRGQNLGQITAEALESGWYLADVSLAGTSLTVRNRYVTESSPPFAIGYNAGVASILVQESNGNSKAVLNYRFFQLDFSKTSVSISVGSSTSFNITAKEAGNLTVTNSDNTVISVTSSLSSSGGVVNISARKAGSSTITVRGSTCGVKTIRVTVTPKTRTAWFVAGNGISKVTPASKSCEIRSVSQTSCTVVLPLASQVTSKTGYVAKGMGNTSTTLDYSFGSTVTLTSNKTFYAVGEPMYSPSAIGHRLLYGMRGT